MTGEKCTGRPVWIALRPSERKDLEEWAQGRPLAAVVREKLGFDPAMPGRRWPQNSADRHWRRPVE
jgi:hypothetical protein